MIINYIVNDYGRSFAITRKPSPMYLPKPTNGKTDQINADMNETPIIRAILR